MVALTVNGEPAVVAAGEDTPLLDVLRNQLGLTGARYGCGSEQCGACVVLVDGARAPSPLRPRLSDASIQRHRREDRGEAARRDHCSGTPALRRPSRIGSSWVR